VLLAKLWVKRTSSRATSFLLFSLVSAAIKLSRVLKTSVRRGAPCEQATAFIAAKHCRAAEALAALVAAVIDGGAC